VTADALVDLIDRQGPTGLRRTRGSGGHGAQAETGLRRTRGSGGHGPYRHRRERFQERLAVVFGRDSGVEHHDDAVVGRGADQATEALAKLDHRFGQLVIAKRISAAAADRFEPGLQQRVVGTLNGSLVMMTFCSASPGTSTPCQKLSVPNRTLRFDWPKTFEQLGAILVAGLAQQQHPFFVEPGQHRRGGVAIGRNW
jgi:hypothetical protein